MAAMLAVVVVLADPVFIVPAAAVILALFVLVVAPAKATEEFFGFHRMARGPCGRRLRGINRGRRCRSGIVRSWR
jgi:hypothetical protein